MARLRLYFETVRHLSPRQWWYRGRRIVRHRWWSLTRKQAPLPAAPPLAAVPNFYQGLVTLRDTPGWAQLVAPYVAAANAVAEGHFTFLHKTVSWQEAPDWHMEGLSPLWRYHLHYFDYVRSLLIWGAAGKQERAAATFRHLATAWMEQNRTLKGAGWHPYTLSLRIVNWLNALIYFREQWAQSSFVETLSSSIYGQARMLRADLEFDVRGNHLLENIRALIWAGSAFTGEEPSGWLSHGLILLARETEEQILDDGGHFERVPGYQLVVLRNYLEIAVWLQRCGRDVPEWLDAAIRRMADFVVATLPPDGRPALFKDTAWDAAPEPLALLAAVAQYLQEPRYKRTENLSVYSLLLFGNERWAQLQGWPVRWEQPANAALVESGYCVMRDTAAGDYLIIDVGKPCPDYNPAHAHADLFSFELFAGSARIVVDSGVYEYSPGPWRDFFRSTRAHNTVVVAGENQSEVWSSFRVGRRAQPEILHWRETGRFTILQAAHNGYQRLRPPVRHRRTLLWCRDGFWLVVDDLIGVGSAQANSYLHFHPRLSPLPVDGNSWSLEGAEVPFFVTPFAFAEAICLQGQTGQQIQGWYSERFGERLANHVLVFTTERTLPQRFGYVLSRTKPATVSLDGPLTTVAYGDRYYSLIVDNDSPRIL